MTGKKLHFCIASAEHISPFEVAGGAVTHGTVGSTFVAGVDRNTGIAAVHLEILDPRIRHAAAASGINGKNHF